MTMKVKINKQAVRTSSLHPINKKIKTSAAHQLAQRKCVYVFMHSCETNAKAQSQLTVPAAISSCHGNLSSLLLGFSFLLMLFEELIKKSTPSVSEDTHPWSTRRCKDVWHDLPAFTLLLSSSEHVSVQQTEAPCPSWHRQEQSEENNTSRPCSSEAEPNSTKVRHSLPTWTECPDHPSVNVPQTHYFFMTYRERVWHHT